MAYKAINTERDNKIEADFRAGVSIVKIGEKHGITRQRVAAILHARGLGRDDGGAAMAHKKEKGPRDEAIELGYLAGKSTAKLSAEHGLRPRNVREVLAKRGVEVKRKRDPKPADIADELLGFLESSSRPLDRQALFERAEERAKAARGKASASSVNGGQA